MTLTKRVLAGLLLLGVPASAQQITSAPAARHPPYRSGLSYSLVPISAAAGAIGAVDTIYFVPFFIDQPITFTGAVVRVTTGGAGSSMKTAIWANDNSGIRNRPIGAPLTADNTGVDTSGSGTNPTPAISGTLAAGTYWYGVKFTGTLPQLLLLGGNNQNFSWLAGSTALNITGISIADSYANNMPTLTSGSVFTSVATNTFPCLGLTF